MAAAVQCCGAAAPAPAMMPSAMWDNMKDWYTTNMAAATSTLASTLHSQLGLLSPDADAPALEVLETHCADAVAAGRLLPAPRVARYTACDFSSKMVEAAAARLGDRATVLEADSTKLAFEDASFDRYMSNMGACCVSDLDAKLKEMYRVLRPGGVAAFSMRVEDKTGDNAGDTSLSMMARVLSKYGMPEPPSREGLHIGKNLPALRAKLAANGFQQVVAWNTWIPLPIYTPSDYVKWVLASPMAAKCLSALSEDQKAEALKDLEAAAAEALGQGCLQIAVAAAVAHKP